MADFQKAAEIVWEALDKMSAESPEQYKTFINKQLEEGAEMMSPPMPDHCLTCSAIYKGKEHKLFLNVCKWKKIPSPKQDIDPVPVKGGILRRVVENKRKTPDLLYDVALNPKVIEECLQQTVLLNMLHSLILEFVNDTLNIRVDNDSLKYVQGKFKGLLSDITHSLAGSKQLISDESQLDMRQSILETLSKQTSNHVDLPPLRIKPESNNKSLIEELPSCSNVSKGEKEDSLQYSLLTKNQCFIIKVYLPDNSTATDVNLEISEDDIFLAVKDFRELTIELPHPVNPDTAKAKLYISKKELELCLPFR